MLGRPAAPVADRVFGPPEDPRMYQLIEETLGTEMHGVSVNSLSLVQSKDARWDPYRAQTGRIWELGIYVSGDPR